MNFKPKWSPKGAQRDPKNEELGRHFAAPPLDPPKGAKLSQNGTPGDAGVWVFGAKLTPKWRQNGVKIGSNRGANSRENPKSSTEHR